MPSSRDAGEDSWLDGWCSGWYYEDHGFDPGPSTADICDLIIYSTGTGSSGTETMTRDEYDALADPAYDSLGDFIDGVGSQPPCAERPVYGDTTSTCEDVTAWAAITGGGGGGGEDPPPPVVLAGEVSALVLGAAALCVLAVTSATHLGVVMFRRG